jgi:deazaflavin-dependent oxidoreductase (nitroreductase family)
MADPDHTAVGEFNEQVIAEFRANEGRVGGALAGTPILLLHHVGAKSRTERVTPVAYSAHDDGAFVIVASNGGSRTHPGWYYNLRANPRIEVEIATDRFTAVALELDGMARAVLWPKLIEAAPSIGEFQAQTRRQIPLFVLRRENETAGS